MSSIRGYNAATFDAEMFDLFSKTLNETTRNELKQVSRCCVDYE